MRSREAWPGWIRLSLRLSMRLPCLASRAFRWPSSRARISRLCRSPPSLMRCASPRTMATAAGRCIVAGLLPGRASSRWRQAAASRSTVGNLRRSRPVDYLVVVGGLLHRGPTSDEATLDYLREADRKGVTLLGSAPAPSHAGLMDGRRCCVSCSTIMI